MAAATRLEDPGAADAAIDPLEGLKSEKRRLQHDSGILDGHSHGAD